MKKLLIILSFILATVTSFAQLEVTIGASKTELRASALTVGITYLKSIDSIFGHREYFVAGKHSLFLLTPALDIQTGTADAFSSLNLKITGLFSTFKTTTIAGLDVVDRGRTIHQFPISFGVETNNLFNNVATILETGWVPFYQGQTRSTPEAFKHTKFGIFLQAGYKFKAGSSVPPVGGEIDQSQEAPNSYLLRAKGNFAIDTKRLVSINGLDIGLVGNATVWYDFANGATYHKLDGRGRFYLGANSWIDFVYTHGSGAPNFNQGDQWGTALTITFK